MGFSFDYGFLECQILDYSVDLFKYSHLYARYYSKKEISSSTNQTVGVQCGVVAPVHFLVAAGASPKVFKDDK
tara:strand:- start:315 stop:533 length:219 start_codon:yes stop_codon:yes gene_type:complete